MVQLASYAASEAFSRGRVYKEEQPAYRNQFQRDRDRIIHSSAFRRLEYKTQVFVNHEGDMFRTRLTHSIEVSQIGRTVAHALSLNENLTEAICLAHDLGHTPFGHAGQDSLHQCMREYGGFEHNLQSLRVVDVLEERYAEFPGLNLLFETREGIIKHCSRKNAKNLGELGVRFIEGKQAGLEAQIANIADEIAYNNHDIDDGLRSGLIEIEQLKSCELFRQHHDFVTSKWPDIHPNKKIHELIRRMINSLVTDLIETSREKIQSFDLKNIEDVRNAGEEMIVLSEQMQQKHIELKRFLRKELYNNDYIQRMSDKAKHIIYILFEAFSQDENTYTRELAQKLERCGSKIPRQKIHRIIADYIAGMTDRYAIAEYNRITDSRTENFSYCANSELR